MKLKNIFNPMMIKIPLTNCIPRVPFNKVKSLYTKNQTSKISNTCITNDKVPMFDRYSAIIIFSFHKLVK